MSVYDYFSKQQPFEVKRGHLSLMKRMYVEWDDSCYEGVPCVDRKRPYGNSHILGDLQEILFDEQNNYPLKEIESDDFHYMVTEGEFVDIHEDSYRNVCSKYHHEMHIVLQIVLSIGSIDVGKYICYRYPQWKRIEE